MVEIRIDSRRARAARLRAAQPRLCLELAHLPALDGRHVAGAARHRAPLPAQPDQADPDAGRGRRAVRQGPSGRAISGRAARARCGRRRRPSSTCATRIERQIEQRTTMLSGVSHDLRTVLTRFQLELALLGETRRHGGAARRCRRDDAHAGGLPGLRAGRRRRGRPRSSTCPRCWRKSRRMRGAAAAR